MIVKKFSRVVEYADLKGADIVVDTLYRWGPNGTRNGETVSILMNTESSGGFRRLKKKSVGDRPMASAKDLAYICLTSSMSEREWPDYLDVSTGILRYYGDNRKANKDMFDTPKQGNQILSWVFDALNKGNYSDIPPFFVFQKIEHNGTMFRGLAVPGNPDLSSDRELVAIWRATESYRFQNYEAYFTILDVSEIPRDWLEARVEGLDNCDDLAPKVWKDFVKKGRLGIKALKAERTIKVPSINQQLPDTDEGRLLLRKIYEHYDPTTFEKVATEIVKLSDPKFCDDFVVTRAYKDGGIDAVGRYKIGSDDADYPLFIPCLIQAKRYKEDQVVNTKDVSRLVARMRNSTIGVFVTTSYIGEQAYKEVLEDKVPLLIITGGEIVKILRRKGYSSKNIETWFDYIDSH